MQTQYWVSGGFNTRLSEFIKFDAQLVPFIINLIPRSRLNPDSWTIFMVILVRADPEISHREQSDKNGLQIFNRQYG